MNSRILTGIALAGSLVVATLGAAGAQVAPIPGAPIPGAPAPAPYGYGTGGYGTGQYNSNVNIGRASGHVARAIRTLQHDDRDYGGHRVNAINDLGNAHNELVAAEQWAQSHGSGTPQNQSGAHRGHGGGRGGHGRRNEGASNNNIAEVQAGVARIMSHLQRDSQDYGGHRAAALNWMQQANNELIAAVQWDQAHPR